MPASATRSARTTALKLHRRRSNKWWIGSWHTGTDTAPGACPGGIGEKGRHVKLLDDIKKQGFVRVRIDGEMLDLGEEIELDKNKKHSIDIVVDRIVIKDGIEPRLADSLETALKLADGRVVIDVIGEEELLFSEHLACPICGFSIDKLEPRMFSFNSPFGACPECDGLGAKLEVDPSLVIPDASLTLNEGAIAPWEPISSQYYPQLLKAVCAHFGIDMDTPVKDLPKHQMEIILYGSGNERIYFHYENDFGQVRDNMIQFEGVLNNIERRYRETSSDFTREQMERYIPAAMPEMQRLPPETGKPCCESGRETYQ